jgi:translation initiation factor IF-3
MLGVMSAYDAIRLAESSNLDLVKINPTAVPPVCKIMDYGKYKFEQSKKDKEARKNQKVVELKELYLSATIDTGDLRVKAKAAQGFLQAGDKVRASIRLKGRQQAHPEVAMKVMSDFFELIAPYGQKEKEPVLEGRTIAFIVTPLVKK